MADPQLTTNAEATAMRKTFERMESEVQSYARSFPVTFAKAKGAWLEGYDGKKYLDFLTGCSSLNYGHNHPKLKKALVDYIMEDGLTHSLDMHTEAKADFLRTFESKILQPRGLDYVVQFPGPTGANAVEAAIKLARKVTGRSNVIAFTNGFHGVTLGALALTGNEHHRGGGAVPLGNVSRMPYAGYLGDESNTLDQLEQMLHDPSSGVDSPAAIILETVQGEGGLNTASDQWLQRVAKIAREAGALLIVDDIQAGAGRTGTFFSFEPSGVKPDIVTLAKSLSGFGLPFATVLIDRKYDIWKPGEHNGTFRGNCHAFVTAKAAIEEFWSDDSFEAEIAERGRLIEESLDHIAKEVGSNSMQVKGRGMMLGLDVGSGELAGDVVAACFKRGLVIETSGPHGEVVKCLPPLNIDIEDLKSGLSILEEAVTHTA